MVPWADGVSGIDAFNDDELISLHPEDDNASFTSTISPDDDFMFNDSDVDSNEEKLNHAQKKMHVALIAYGITIAC